MFLDLIALIELSNRGTFSVELWDKFKICLKVLHLPPVQLQSERMSTWTSYCCFTPPTWYLALFIVTTIAAVVENLFLITNILKKLNENHFDSNLVIFNTTETTHLALTRANVLTRISHLEATWINSAKQTFLLLLHLQPPFTATLSKVFVWSRRRFLKEKRQD